MFNAITLLVVAATVSRVAPTDQKLCKGDKAEGDIVNIGRYWYACKNGDLIQRGCLSEDGKIRLNARETYKSNGYVVECTETQGVFGFANKACLSEDGKEHAPKDTWQDVNYWYTCLVNSNNRIIRVEMTGCVDDGKRYTIGESFEKSDLIYICSQSGDYVIWEVFPKNSKEVDVKID